MADNRKYVYLKLKESYFDEGHLARVVIVFFIFS